MITFANILPEYKNELAQYRKLKKKNSMAEYNGMTGRVIFQEEWKSFRVIMVWICMMMFYFKIQQKQTTKQTYFTLSLMSTLGHSQVGKCLHLFIRFLTSFIFKVKRILDLGVYYNLFIIHSLGIQISYNYSVYL